MGPRNREPLCTYRGSIPFTYLVKSGTFNPTVETNRCPALPFDAERESGCAVYALSCISGAWRPFQRALTVAFLAGTNPARKKATFTAVAIASNQKLGVP
jgi:hypothetical protein